MAAVAVLLLSSCSKPAPSPEPGSPIARAEYAVKKLGLTVSYLHAGTAGGRRVVFVHGTPGSADGWASFLRNVPKGFEYIAVDRPGFGSTRPGAPVTSLAGQAEALEPLLDSPRTILVGHSYGGPVIVEAAALYPDRVAGIVVLAGALDPAQEHVNPLQYVGAWPGVRSLIPRAWRSANSELIPLKGELEALAPLLPRVRAAVTIVHGTKDSLVPISNVGYMTPRFTHAASLRTIVLPGQSHFLPWEHQPIVESAIAAMAAGT